MTQARRLRRLALLLLAGVTMLQSGCLWLAVGAGTAACCAGGYAYLKGELPQTFAASFDDSWAAAHKALGELGMTVVNAEKKNSISGTIRTKLGNGETVTVQVDEEPRAFPTDAPLTRIGVRVAVLGDYPVSERILNQVASHLPRRGPAAPQPAGGTPVVQQPPATWTPASVTPPPPPISAGTPPPPPQPSATAPPPAGLPTSTAPPPAAPPPAVGLPASTPPPPLAGPEH